MEQCVVIVPMYKSTLEWYEEISLKQLVKILSKYQICLCVPENFNINNIKMYTNFYVERFECEFFKNVDGYNRLMLSKEFYKRFCDFKYMLIYQLDALVFSDKLNYFIDLGYDYIGAPWFGQYIPQYGVYKSKVGNGGLSLRTIDGAIRLLDKFQKKAEEWKNAEDVFFSIYGKQSPEIFKLAPFSVAVSFSFERMAARCYRYTKYKLPFGCHKWMLYSSDFYIEIFDYLNINVNGYAEYMRSDDKYDGIMALKKALLERFIKKKNIKLYINDREEVSIYGFGKQGKIIYEFLKKNGIKIINVYDKRTMQYDCGKITKNPIAFKNEYAGEFIVVSTSKYENDIIKFLTDNKLKNEDDFVSIYERLYNSIFGTHY